MKNYVLRLEDINILAKKIAENFPHGVLILKGDLAAGKTTLVKEIVKSFGLEDEVTSPTFSLQHSYSDRVYHYDIYNKGLDNFISLGMLEELEKHALHIIEWGDDKLKELLDSAGFEVMVIEIEKISSDEREYKVDYA